MTFCTFDCSLQYDTLVTIVTQLKESPREVTFDLAGRAEYRDPERMERTVYVSPLSTNVTPEMIKVCVGTACLLTIFFTVYRK